MSAASEPQSLSASLAAEEREPRPAAPLGGAKGAATMDLAAYVTVHALENDLGRGFAAGTGFLVGRAPNPVLAPDFAFILRDHLPSPMPPGPLAIVPDLVLETRTAGDGNRDIAARIKRWLTLGVRVVWEMDPAAQTITIYRPGRYSQRLDRDHTLQDETILPGFSLPLNRIFRAPLDFGQ